MIASQLAYISAVWYCTYTTQRMSLIAYHCTKNELLEAPKPQQQPQPNFSWLQVNHSFHYWSHQPPTRYPHISASNRTHRRSFAGTTPSRQRSRTRPVDPREGMTAHWTFDIGAALAFHQSHGTLGTFLNVFRHARTVDRLTK